MPLHSLDSGVARCTETFTRAGVAAGTMAALARQLAALAVGARCAEIFAAPATEAWGAHAGTGDGVAQGTVLALAAVAAVWAPVVAVTACKRGRERTRSRPHLLERSAPLGQGPRIFCHLASFLCLHSFSRCIWARLRCQATLPSLFSPPQATEVRTVVCSIQLEASGCIIQ